MAIDEFSVREVLGVSSIYNGFGGENSSVRLIEGEERISLLAYTPRDSYPPELTPDEARRLARQLHRLATRIENRQAS